MAAAERAAPTQDIHDWNITFVDTGLAVQHRHSACQLAKKYLEGEEMFLANYSDGLTNLTLDKMIERFGATNKVGASCAPSRGRASTSSRWTRSAA